MLKKLNTVVKSTGVILMSFLNRMLHRGRILPYTDFQICASVSPQGIRSSICVEGEGRASGGRGIRAKFGKNPGKIRAKEEEKLGRSTELSGQKLDEWTIPLLDKLLN